MAHHKANIRIAAAAQRAYLEKTHQTDTECVRIYTDASYNNQKKIGAIAYIIIDGQHKTVEEYTESFCGRTNSTYLELLAVRNALSAAQTRFTNKEYVVISDCKSVVDSINQKTSFKKKMTNFQEVVAEIQRDYTVKCEFTRAHTHRHTSDSEHNRRVDMMARREMKKEARRYQAKKKQHDSLML